VEGSSHRRVSWPLDTRTLAYGTHLPHGVRLTAVGLGDVSRDVWDSPIMRAGSKPVRLSMSPCLPLCPQQQDMSRRSRDVCVVLRADVRTSGRGAITAPASAPRAVFTRSARNLPASSAGRTKAAAARRAAGPCSSLSPASSAPSRPTDRRALSGRTTTSLSRRRASAWRGGCRRCRRASRRSQAGCSILVWSSRAAAEVEVILP
jgi:hypothetical protein